MKINIAEDFSPVPAGRYVTDGPDSGERFRQEFLVPAVEDEGRIEIVIDGTAGYGSSFLEEAFGGLVRRKLVTKDELISRLTIRYSDPEFELYRDLILQFIEDAVPGEIG